MEEGQTSDRRTKRSGLFIPYDNKKQPVDFVPFPFPTEMVNSDKCLYLLFKAFTKRHYWNSLEKKSGADIDQTTQNADSDQRLHYLLK